MSERSSEQQVDILLVEDNPGDVRLTQEAFKNGQICNALHVVTDGAEALDFLHKRGDYEDAPTPDLARTPVIVLTSSGAQEDVVQSYDLQANAYLTKPVDPGEFIEVVQSFKTFWLSVVRLPPGDEQR